MRAEMERRFGESASIEYVDVAALQDRGGHAARIATVEERGLLYPVTFVEEEPIYDGAVSYPMILRAVEERLAGVTG